MHILTNHLRIMYFSCTDRGILYLILLYEQSGVDVGQYRLDECLAAYASTVPPFVHVDSSSLFSPSPFLWGEAALEQYRIKQEVSWLLWKQPGTQEVVELLDRELLLRSGEVFPLDVDLDVSY